MTNVIVPTFRFNFSEEFNKELEYFSKLHENDDRADFKKCWTEWMNDNEKNIDNEKRRLKCLGYDGNVDDKMYTSVRYYFRKKYQKEKKTRSIRVKINKEILQLMDEHINKNKLIVGYTPQTGYYDFCKENDDMIKREMLNLLQQIEDADNIKTKVKKTYKNRFYLLCRK
jgi:hypothetical protein